MSKRTVSVDTCSISPGHDTIDHTGGLSLKKCLRSKNRRQYWRQLGRNSVKNQRQKIGEGKLQQRDTKG